MSDSCYQPLSPYSLFHTRSFQAETTVHSLDPRMIKLEQVDYKITSSNSFRVYNTIILFLITARLVNDIFGALYDAPVFLLPARVLQVIGFICGFAVHSSKSYCKFRFFFAFLIFSLGICACICHESLQTSNWLIVFEDVTSFFLNVFLIKKCYDLIKLMEEKNRLVISLDEPRELSIEQL